MIVYQPPSMLHAVPTGIRPVVGPRQDGGALQAARRQCYHFSSQGFAKGSVSTGPEGY